MPSTAISRRRALSCLLSAPLLNPLLRGQFSTSIKVINVLATVRDKDGKIVKGLTRDDFALSEDGRAQNIQYFTQQSDLGRGGGMGGGGHRGGGGRQAGFHGGGTKFYDAIYLAGDELLSKQKGRKAIIMLTDGEDNGSKETVESAIHSAQRAEMLGYSIHIADNESGFSRGFGGGGYGGGRGGGYDRPDGKKILKQISKSTGGGYFEFKKSLDDIYTQINEELRNQYSIGYTSDKPESDGAFRKIDLTVKQKGLIVQSRDGYYS